MQKVVITGAGGIAGTLLRPVLRDRYALVLVDRQPLTAQPGERAVQGDILDRELLLDAFAGATAIVHLAGISTEGGFEPMIDVNIRGTHTVLEAARECGVRRVLVASSAHAVGAAGIDRAHLLAPDDVAPGSFYGASKVAVEAISRVHASKFGMRIVLARIGTVLAEPRTKRQLATWLSPDDLGRLVDATVGLQQGGAFPVWAVSANARRWVDLSAGRVIGYVPRDDSEHFAPPILANPDDDSLAWSTLGGPWSGPDPDFRWQEANP
ncbi:NAD(P)-dependent oxidoreductase [Agromyces sp. ISL-38]|uniref:NAD-dependent epimerase/dehydratase family protein n=1 Tax=Agromyces sp. ISL-38 TaxID=2819107 RepID=UPI001BE87FDD|nr:NAD(P)-dependent oxidoreductase [Agromyces sp. ISL-38]MBT2497929.1 NAD(P)-dependent oxidoreductase [Agromyces sp. ISL-38]